MLEMLDDGELVNTLKSRLTEAKFPIFDECESRRISSLAAVTIRCDQHPGGVKGVGAAVIVNKLRSFKAKGREIKEQEKEMVRWMSDKSGIGESILNTLTDTLMFEPSNIEGLPFSYISESPVSLDRYLAKMALPEMEVVGGHEMATCPGIGIGGEHKFLVGESSMSIQCSRYEKLVCQFCHAIVKQKDETEKTYCLPCYSDTVLLPGGGIVANKTTAEIREMLLEKGVQCQADVDPNIIEDLYIEHILEDKLDFFKDNVIDLPLLPSKQIPSCSSIQNSPLEIKCMYTASSTWY